MGVRSLHGSQPTECAAIGPRQAKEQRRGRGTAIHKRGGVALGQHAEAEMLFSPLRYRALSLVECGDVGKGPSGSGNEGAALAVPLADHWTCVVVSSLRSREETDAVSRHGPPFEKVERSSRRVRGTAAERPSRRA